MLNATRSSQNPHLHPPIPPFSTTRCSKFLSLSAAPLPGLQKNQNIATFHQRPEFLGPSGASQSRTADLSPPTGGEWGLPKRPSVSNTLCPYQTPAEEQAAREEAVAAQLAAYHCMLPQLLKKLTKIPEPRQPKKLKHKLTVVLRYGLLMCVFQMASRPEANAELSKPVFLSTLQQLFPDLYCARDKMTLQSALKSLFFYKPLDRAREEQGRALRPQNRPLSSSGQAAGRLPRPPGSRLSPASAGLRGRSGGAAERRSGLRR